MKERILLTNSQWGSTRSCLAISPSLSLLLQPARKADLSLPFPWCWSLDKLLCFHNFQVQFVSAVEQWGYYGVMTQKPQIYALALPFTSCDLGQVIQVRKVILTLPVSQAQWHVDESTMLWITLHLFTSPVSPDCLLCAGTILGIGWDS